MRHSVGQCIDDRYEILAVLGEGALAEVYHAVDRASGRQVVLKLPHLAMGGQVAGFNAYRRETEIMRGLEHRGLRRLISGTDARYIVLEYVAGQPLRSYLATAGPLPVEDALRIAIQLAQTLGYVHEQGIVHRDLKPENILIGPDGRVTLADFGIAMRLGSRGITLNHLAHAVGTPGYMAPEQVRGERGDVRIDVYALGVLLYELLTGVVPYPAQQAPDTSRRGRVQVEPALVRRLRPDVPPALEAVVYRAIRRRPAQRYPSMAALCDDLCELDRVAIPVTYEPDEAPPVPPGDLPPWRTTVPILAIVLGILTVFGVVGELLHRGLAAR